MSNLAPIVLGLYRICTQLISMCWCCVAPYAYKQSGGALAMPKDKVGTFTAPIWIFLQIFYIPCNLPISDV
jgi:hypothetical protein